MVTFEHMKAATGVKDCCRVLDNLIPETSPVERKGLTMRRCKVCKARHFNQKAEHMNLKMTPIA